MESDPPAEPDTVVSGKDEEAGEAPTAPTDEPNDAEPVEVELASG